MRRLAKFILFHILKWKILGDSKLPKKCVIIVAPHTHWQDIIYAIIIRKVINQEINFIGKKELFKFPFGFFFRMMGGKPVDRGSNSNTVEIIAEMFKNNNEFRLGISPEGTRNKVKKWKTGFYYISKTAGVPIISATLNFKDKSTRISEPFYPTNNRQKDFKKLKLFFRGVKGKVEEFS
tara:strand:+ start:263 stop:799 length:537 start_codon:yes stop_codon:yes gene_type:complete